MRIIETASMRDSLSFNLEGIYSRFNVSLVVTGIIWLLVPVIALSALYVAPGVFVWLVYHYMRVVPTVPVLN